MLKKENGVTLVALVITIIVLLILAGVTLAMVMGDSGIFSKANEASEQTNIASAKDAVRLATLEAVTDQYDTQTGAVTSANEITSANVVTKVNAKLTAAGGEYTIDASDSNKIKKGTADTGLTVTFTVTSSHSVTPVFNK